ncbi:MAG TPA: adenylate/guanylate cyclase domain-containing protein [Myxococcaceae bacterium]|nr:adenylate/guanylate cyclase domain-containing protein [Myxococcaceae bacterium]
MPRIIANPGQPDEQVFRLEPGNATLGRTEDNPVHVAHPSLSRQHARLEVDKRHAVLVDLNSKNGTFAGGARVTRHVLGPGDRFRCGEVTFRFEPDEAVSEPVVATLVRDIRADFTRAAGTELVAPPRGASGTVVAPRHGTRVASGNAEDRLRIVLRVSELLSSPLPIDALLDRILELLFQILPVDRAAILMVDEATDALVVRAIKTSTPVQPGERIYSQSIVQYVRERSVAALFANAREDARLRDAASILVQSICASMCAPLLPRDRTLGVLYVDNQRLPGGFSERDLDLLTAFANQAAIALENAALYRRVEEEAIARSRFLRFFPPATARRILETQEALDVIETDVTALFSDISGFTAMSSQLPPRAVIELLNQYFPVMSDIVFRHEGTLEKYIGDALLAVWGAPFSHPDDVDRAMRAAIQMHQALARLNADWTARGKSQLAIHIGVNTGPIAAGNIGSDRYLQYATIGDTTNVASRICGAAAPGELLISASTAERWRECHAPLERVPATAVKGKEAPLELFRVRWDLAPATGGGG